MWNLQPDRPASFEREIKDEIIAGIAAGSLAMGQKVYDQCMEQTVRMLAEMEERLRAEFVSVTDLMHLEGNRSAPTDSEGAE